MGRRRRGRKIRVRVKKKLPTLFQCPRCGFTTVSVLINKKLGTATVKCSSCGLTYTFEYNQYLQPVDYYSRYLDKFEEGVPSEEESEEVSVETIE
ncbi:MAG: hypothetical protein B6U94_01520 [Thermofilum sp. ex4484_79]|nr:MAG: hypothetical protein B6U94_01520 [Thermofilum sp. ex4484_79]